MSDFIQQFLYYLAAVLGLLLSVAPFVYAPFAKTWTRAMSVQIILGFAWGLTRLISIIYFNEESPPGVFFLILPIEYLVYAAITRSLKIFLFKFPALKAFEEKIRTRITGICLGEKNIK
jgi:hypothetical protein